MHIQTTNNDEAYIVKKYNKVLVYFTLSLLLNFCLGNCMLAKSNGSTESLKIIVKLIFLTGKCLNVLQSDVSFFFQISIRSFNIK